MTNVITCSTAFVYRVHLDVLMEVLLLDGILHGQNGNLHISVLYLYQAGSLTSCPLIVWTSRVLRSYWLMKTLQSHHYRGVF